MNMHPCCRRAFLHAQNKLSSAVRKLPTRYEGIEPCLTYRRGIHGDGCKQAGVWELKSIATSIVPRGFQHVNPFCSGCVPPGEGKGWDVLRTRSHLLARCPECCNLSGGWGCETRVRQAWYLGLLVRMATPRDFSLLSRLCSC